jgi:hypothetical protein
VGLLELFAGHGQNRFYRELEEWLSGITRLGFSAEGDSGGEQAAALSALEHMAEQMSGLRELFESSEASRSMMDDRVERLVSSVETLAATLQSDTDAQAILARIADGQTRVAELLESRPEGGVQGVDAESRMRLRSMDVQLLRILEEMSAGRQESISELRSDLAQLTRAVKQIGKDSPPPLAARRSI